MSATPTWNRLVVKLGSALLAREDGSFDEPLLDALVDQIASLMGRGIRVVVVSSGAIAAGMAGLGYRRRPTELRKLQAAASVGQGVLMRMYEERFKRHQLLVAQVLLTQADLAHRQRYINARHTLETLLESRVIPIVNENDAVAVDEIKFGDNDRLSALVAHVVNADGLVILTNVDGFLRHGELVERIERITPELERLARGPRHTTSAGGMVTKLQAARLAMHAGIPLVIAHGRTPDILRTIVDGGARCTWFLPRAQKLTMRKRWLAFGRLRAHGHLVVDAGAKAALTQRHTSLLPSGIVAVQGQFAAGEVVAIIDEEQRELARGLANYGSKEIERIRGKKSHEIAGILGAKRYDEVVHRDNLVVTWDRDGDHDTA